MKALAINGSPRANMNHLGQTIAWLGAALASVPETSPFPKLAVELH